MSFLQMLDHWITTGNASEPFNDPGYLGWTGRIHTHHAHLKLALHTNRVTLTIIDPHGIRDQFGKAFTQDRDPLTVGDIYAHHQDTDGYQTFRIKNDVWVRIHLPRKIYQVLDAQDFHVVQEWPILIEWDKE